MTRTSIAGIIVAAFLAVSAYAQAPGGPTAPGMPPGMSGCFGTEQAEVLKVFSAEDNGARFRAYQVKWKDQDIIVSDMFGSTSFKEGDTITFMAQNLEVPAGEKMIKMLNFLIMDTSAFTESNDPSE